MELKEARRGGLVFNIQKYTIHDGPGIRTSVFLKGCPLRCIWCSNPEGISPYPQIGVYPDKCLTINKCGLCVNACPENNHSPIAFDDNGRLKAVSMIDTCSRCFKCVDACPGRAIMRWGMYWTVDELMKVILEDRSFYQRTGGGVTLNGGEVTTQWEFARDLLQACKNASISTCVETALHCSADCMEELYRQTDLVITDIKTMDAEKHVKFTGAGNERILNNIRRTVEMGKPLVIRAPVVPGHNDGVDDLRKIGEFIRDELGNKIVQCQLLPYRRLGTEKYASIGMPYPMEDFNAPERAVWEKNLLDLAKMLVDEFGIPAAAGASNKGNLRKP